MPTEQEIQSFNAPLAQNPDVKESATLALKGYLERLEAHVTRLQNAISRGEQQAVYTIAADLAVDIAQLKQAVESTAEAIVSHNGHGGHGVNDDESYSHGHHARISKKKR